MNKSPDIGEIAKALHKAQGTLKVAIKDTINPFFKSKFADLQSIWDASRESLQSCGLSVAQFPTMTEDGSPALESILMHVSGQWISAVYPVTAAKNDPQGVGSAITYARRYALQAILGVCADLDDDGEGAAGRGNNKKQDSKGVEQKKMPAWTAEQKAEAGGYVTDIQKILERTYPFSASAPNTNPGNRTKPDEMLAAFRNRTKYDTPADVIDALATWKNDLTSNIGDE